MHKSFAKMGLVFFVMAFVAWLAGQFALQRYQLSQSPTVAPILPPATSVQTESHNEPYYTQLIAKQQSWEAEVTTLVGTRCDLVSEQFAIEVDWPKKWSYAIGQSLHYALELEREPAICFLLSDSSEREYVARRVDRVAEKYGIKVMYYDTQTNAMQQ